jgi:transcriptional regulator with XRE-family HTH domain
MQVMVYIGDNLRRERTLNALTQAQLAVRAGMALATVARIERNEVEPHMTSLRKLADALGVEPRQLMDTAE